MTAVDSSSDSSSDGSSDGSNDSSNDNPAEQVRHSSIGRGACLPFRLQ